MNPLKDTDPEVIEKLTRWGGCNVYGDPNWRIILAENHLVQRAGMWTEFAEGTESVSPTGKDFQMETRHIQPDAIRCGVFWVPLYPCKGWVLERWFPPATFGNREQWESALSQDNETPMMGPFPDHGEYFMLLGPWEKIPDLEAVRQSICSWENSQEHLHGYMDEEKLLKTINDAEKAATERENAIHAAFLKETEYACKHNLSFIKGNPALTAFRNHMAQKEGFTSHI